MIGATLGPYTIDRELGSGGMGKVYAATGPEGVVALKVVHTHLLETEGFLARFLREGEIGAAIRHPNVVSTLGCRQIDGTHVMVMECVEGQTLASLRGELQRVPEELCRHVAREICKGLSAIHAAGVVHRDLKPENVLITPEQVVKIMDLGVAKLVDAQLALSQPGAFIGSVDYAAPEQFKGGETDHRTDLHALGVLLYELASGEHPFRGGSFHEVFSRVCNEKPKALGAICPQVSALFEEVVHTLLVKEPGGRFASASLLLDVLERGENSQWWQDRARAIQEETKRPLRRVRIPRESAVYGREAELSTLAALFRKAQSGDGQVLLLEGEAGIGKSRLVDELISRLQRDGEDVNFLYGGYPPGGAATVEGGFSSAYREQFGPAGSAAYLPENRVLVPAFDALLRGEGRPQGAAVLDKAALQTCFVRATQGLAAERVTVVLIDDLHFAPDEGRSLFMSLAMAVPGHRVLLVGTARPGVSEEWTTALARLEQTTRLALSRLGPSDLVRLLRDTLRSEHLADRLGGQIALKSDGNPFFVFELLRGLREGRFITQAEDGSWVSTGVIDEIKVPSSVLDLVNVRVAGLSAEERDLLDVACCAGFEFDPLVVAAACGLGRIPALKLLGRIERSHRIVRSAGRRYAFDHHQVQEALYGGLNDCLREEYHAAIAEALESRTGVTEGDAGPVDGAVCAEICEHFLRGGRGSSALRYLGDAQAYLSAGHQHGRVAAIMERALSIRGLLAGRERADALLRMASSLDALGRRADQKSCALEAVDLAEAAGDDELRVRAAIELGQVGWTTASHDAAEAAYRRAEKIARACGDRRAEARVARGLGAVFSDQSRYAEAIECFDRQFALSSEIGDRESQASALVNRGLAHRFLGHVDVAKDELLRGIALSREIGFRFGEATGEVNLAQIYQRQGRLIEAQEHTELGMAISREIGMRQIEAISVLSLGSLRYDFGDLTGARRYIESALALMREIGARYPEGFALMFLALVADELGDSAAALALARESLALRRDTRSATGVADSLIVLGEFLLRKGDEAGAREALEEAVVRNRELGSATKEMRALARLACLRDADPTALAAALAAVPAGAAAGDDMVARLALWRATGDREHLLAARRILDRFLASMPSEHHEPILNNIRGNRELLAAWRAEFGEDG